MSMKKIRPDSKLKKHLEELESVKIQAEIQLTRCNHEFSNVGHVIWQLKNKKIEEIVSPEFRLQNLEKIENQLDTINKKIKVLRGQINSTD